MYIAMVILQTTCCWAVMGNFHGHYTVQVALPAEERESYKVVSDLFLLNGLRFNLRLSLSCILTFYMSLLWISKVYITLVCVLSASEAACRSWQSVIKTSPVVGMLASLMNLMKHWKLEGALQPLGPNQMYPQLQKLSLLENCHCSWKTVRWEVDFQLQCLLAVRS